MQNVRTLFFVLAFISALPVFAYTPEEGKVNLILGPYYYRTNFRNSPQGAVASFKNAMGLIAIGDISDHGSLEIGIFPMSKQYFREYHGGYMGQETSLIHITTGYHFWPYRYLSGSLAIFSAYPIGDATTIHNSIPPGTDPVDTSVSDNAEYGIEGSLQGEIFNSGKFAVVIETRYAFSLTHKNSESADHYGVLLGLRYLIQSEKVHEKAPTNVQ
jgi:hypothetical protein